jgi:dipeptidyl aminopeptidase/acylaminoacyl peptidase
MLIGPFDDALYRSHSPITFLDRLHCPVIFLQGDEDEVVPPSQSERMVDSLISKGIPVAYVKFSGEQHGFRKADSIKRALEAELYFYSKVFQFDVAESLEQIKIHNL